MVLLLFQSLRATLFSILRWVLQEDYLRPNFEGSTLHTDRQVLKLSFDAFNIWELRNVTNWFS
jgi:hypothetical protein